MTALQHAQNVHREFAVMERHIWDASREPEPVHEFAFGDPVVLPQSLFSNRSYDGHCNARFGQYDHAMFWKMTFPGDRAWVLVWETKGCDPVPGLFDLELLRESDDPARSLVPDWVTNDREQIAQNWRAWYKNKSV